MLHWGLELVMTVPKEVDRLAKEVDWSRVTRVWDPWAGTGVIGSVLKGHWDHLHIMNNDWNPQLKWPEAMNALQPGNYRRWKEKYGVNTLLTENDIITYHFLVFWNFKKIRIY